MGKWPQHLQRFRNLLFHSLYLSCQKDFHPVPHKFPHTLLNDKLPQTKTSPGSAASKFHGIKCQHDCYKPWKKVAWLTQRTEEYWLESLLKQCKHTAKTPIKLPVQKWPEELYASTLVPLLIRLEKVSSWGVAIIHCSDSLKPELSTLTETMSVIESDSQGKGPVMTAVVMMLPSKEAEQMWIVMGVKNGNQLIFHKEKHQSHWKTRERSCSISSS